VVSREQLEQDCWSSSPANAANPAQKNLLHSSRRLVLSSTPGERGGIREQRSVRSESVDQTASGVCLVLALKVVSLEQLEQDCWSSSSANAADPARAWVLFWVMTTTTLTFASSLHIQAQNEVSCCQYLNKRLTQNVNMYATERMQWEGCGGVDVAMSLVHLQCLSYSLDKPSSWASFFTSIWAMTELLAESLNARVVGFDMREVVDCWVLLRS
jgi:hypothetical protein